LVGFLGNAKFGGGVGWGISRGLGGGSRSGISTGDRQECIP